MFCDDGHFYLCEVRSIAESAKALDVLNVNSPNYLAHVALVAKSTLSQVKFAPYVLSYSRSYKGRNGLIHELAIAAFIADVREEMARL
jgi:hypothetical protein